MMSLLGDQGADQGEDECLGQNKQKVAKSALKKIEPQHHNPKYKTCLLKPVQ